MNRLDSLMQLHRDHPDDGDLHFMIATEHFNVGRHAESLTWIQGYISRGKDVGAAHGLAAACHLALDDIASARASIQRGMANATANGHPTLAAELRERLDEIEAEYGPSSGH